MKEYTVIYEWGERNWSAYVPDLPGCMSDGETREEAARNIEDAIACWLEEARALGREIPQPKPALRIA